MLPVIVATAVILIIFIRIMLIFSDKISFFSTGFDNGFKFSEMLTLWKLAKVCEIEDPESLYISVPVLNGAIARLISDSKSKGTESSVAVQNFLSKLYDFRTKISMEHENKKKLDSTKYLDKGQRFRIILKGHGVFSAKLENNGYEMTISFPSQKDKPRLSEDDWVGKNISVFFWRNGDAHYSFETKVVRAGVYQARDVLYLAQCSDLLRTQKRQSVRSECNIPAQMYFIKTDDDSSLFDEIDTEPGYKCLLEDISEDGAMVRVGGKGRPEIKIKLQFYIGSVQVVMFGVVRAVEFNATINQSRLHFECLHIDTEMKNAVLSYVYDILPPNEKEILEAMAGAEEDSEADENLEKVVKDERADDIHDESQPASENGDLNFPKENFLVDSDSDKSGESEIKDLESGENIQEVSK